MQKMWKQHQEFMKGNKGFSLVELIIVIAIMAALIAILAPQYLKYVEKSRISADKTQIDEVVNAVKVAVSDPDSNVGSADLTFNVANSNGACTISGGTADLLASVTDALGGDTFTLKSSDGKGAGAFTITVAVADGTYKVACSLDYSNWS